MRQPPKISEDLLHACLLDHYNLIPATLDFLPLGQDDQAGVYRVVSEQGTSYLLKVKCGSLYEPGCLVPAYLWEQGITSVVAPLPTTSKTLWARAEDWTVILYPFITGDTSWAGITDAHWKETGAVFKQIHQVIPPLFGFYSLRKETFDPTGYVRWIREYEAQHAQAPGEESAARSDLRSLWRAHQSTIHMLITSLDTLAETLRSRNLPYVICHADLHPANLLRDGAGRVLVIDWDDVMLAPKERDFIFVKEAPASGSTASTPTSFFQGYGETDIDWLALTYYRYERIVQDVIAYAAFALFRDDVDEEARADAVESFRINLTENGMLAAAEAAASHLRGHSSE
ncbi:MAG TPA: aminoglycoside phosphotransferase family protein [Ktedonobacterales bacterium]|nr:aminoglycoside phosphotransferase family protein [Ktedonobacterales bacterium]